ncbi:MAG: tryptophan halogenase [Asticcacaulis sp. 32-58-5]|nr:MAG: tryptophan halogenase [Asticcacaulis sp. 32-58-5]
MSSAPPPLKSIVIVGGGSAGWMTAAALSEALGQSCAITLIESEAIGTVGVGEATIPPIRHFNRRLGIDEATFVRETQGSCKLGIQFVDWGKLGHSYFHPFGQYGAEFDSVPFYHHWMREYLAGRTSGPIDDFSMCWAMAKQGKFAHPSPDRRQIQSTFDYAYHFDAGLYAAFLRRFSESRGVTRIEGRVVDVGLRGEDGFIEAVTLDNGTRVAGEFFIDCSGFRGLLIEEALHAGYDNWQHWLPCDRAVAVPCERGEFTPYTRSTAKAAGWQWRIPLQHRTGNGYVFCDAYLDEARASELILQRLDGKPQADPRVIRFVTGHRKQMWNKNVIAMGLSSGFLEPLESTSIWLVQEAITKLLKYFPKERVTAVQRECFNRDMLSAYDNVKDFLIAHYKVTEREDTPFWAYCKHMDIPDSLKFRLESFAEHNAPLVAPTELFKDASWFAVLAGQGMVPKSYNPAADVMPDDEFRWRMQRIREGSLGLADMMPSHEAYLAKACPSPQLVAV